MSGDTEEVTAVGGGVTQGGHEAREEGSEEAQQGGVQTKYSIFNAPSDLIFYSIIYKNIFIKKYF